VFMSQFVVGVSFLTHIRINASTLLRLNTFIHVVAGSAGFMMNRPAVPEFVQ